MPDQETTPASGSLCRTFPGQGLVQLDRRCMDVTEPSADTGGLRFSFQSLSPRGANSQPSLQPCHPHPDTLCSVHIPDVWTTPSATNLVIKFNWTCFQDHSWPKLQFTRCSVWLPVSYLSLQQWSDGCPFHGAERSMACCPEVRKERPHHAKELRGI